MPADVIDNFKPPDPFQNAEDRREHAPKIFEKPHKKGSRSDRVDVDDSDDDHQSLSLSQEG